MPNVGRCKRCGRMVVSLAPDHAPHQDPVVCRDCWTCPNCDAGDSTEVVSEGPRTVTRCRRCGRVIHATEKGDEKPQPDSSGRGVGN